MVGTIAQQTAIVSHGNQALVSGKINGRFLENTVFRYCADVNFIRTEREKRTKRAKGYMLAKDPNEWFGLLLKDGCKKLKLFYLPPKKEAMPAHMTAGFIGGGGTWLIEARYDGRSDYWTGKWKIKDRDAPDKKIWTVYYAKIDFNRMSDTDTTGPEDVKAGFSAVLDEICGFAQAQGLTHWAGVFDSARSTLNSKTPGDDYYHKALIVKENYSLAARQLLFAAGMAWVFGGMGSWNDLGFKDEETTDKYNKLSAELFDTIKQAILASVNSY